ncbi:hypothetical protein ASPTUDRAFT_550333 [Aspergillus tubingensis CBS 134.48]|uniref:Uncharacterized protein n=1 Tax=Aspergillus tubingensis (strain CBS 134.48) TaxID=767770 RepID=A0A1L9N6M4_ASPTC|nr:hypothetical protein ASPTUDRAFT_550333 [Aspergillus tubingensis CBS 134.48]
MPAKRTITKEGLRTSSLKIPPSFAYLGSGNSHTRAGCGGRSGWASWAWGSPTQASGPPRLRTQPRMISNQEPWPRHY